MAFVVLMCPGCRSALVADDDNETTTCTRCDDRITIDEMRFFHRSDEHEQAVHAAGALNARQDGDVEDYLDAVGADEPVRSPIDTAVRRGRDASGDDAVEAVLALAEREDLTTERVEELLDRLDEPVDRAETVLERLADRGDLYRPRNGVYRRSASSG